MRRTALRTKEMHTKYLTFSKDPNFFETALSIKEFVHWRIINNNFPYDAITDTHHMLIPKRQAASKDDLEAEEMVEFVRIEKWLEQNYDAVMLNFPKNQSQPHWLHYHLLDFKEV